MTGFEIGSLVAAGLAAATSAVGVGGAFTSARKQYKYNSKLQKEQAALNQQAFETSLAAQERLNSPEYMIQKYREAGIDINPQALVNNGAGIGVSAPQMTPANAAPAPVDYQQSGVQKAQALGSLSDALFKVVEQSASVRRLTGDLDEQQQRIMNLAEDSALKAAQKIAQKTHNTYLAKQIQSEIDERNARTFKTKRETRKLIAETYWMNRMNSAMMNKMVAEIDNIVANTKLTERQRKHLDTVKSQIEESIKNSKKQRDMYDASIGKDQSSSEYQRMVNNFFDNTGYLPSTGGVLESIPGIGHNLKEKFPFLVPFLLTRGLFK